MKDRGYQIQQCELWYFLLIKNESLYQNSLLRIFPFQNWCNDIFNGWSGWWWWCWWEWNKYAWWNIKQAWTDNLRLQVNIILPVQWFPLYWDFKVIWLVLLIWGNMNTILHLIIPWHMIFFLRPFPNPNITRFLQSPNLDVRQHQLLWGSKQTL